jgi:mono/diheme cytochrome c family protein
MSSRPLVVPLTSLVLAGWLACGDAGERAPQPESPPPAAEPAPDPAPEPAPAAGDAERGSAVYAMFCASCHGARGAGDGPLAANLDPKPADHSDGRYMNALSDEHLVRVIRDGGAAVGKSPLMAPWGGSLDEQKILDLVAYIRTLAVPPPGP